MAGDPQRERLTGAGLADHHLYASAAAAQVADHAALVLPNRWVLRQRLPDRRRRAHPSLLALPLDRAGDQALLDPEQFRRGVAALPHRPLGHNADGTVLEEPVGQAL